MKTALALLLSLTAVPAAAQAPCGPANTMLQELRTKFQEVPIWRGTLGEGTEAVFTHSKGGTWSFLAIDDGKACMIAAGNDGAPVPTGQGV